MYKTNGELMDSITVLGCCGGLAAMVVIVDSEPASTAISVSFIVPYCALQCMPGGG